MKRQVMVRVTESRDYVLTPAVADKLAAAVKAHDDDLLAAILTDPRNHIRCDYVGMKATRKPRR